jgi:lysozyme family protein
MSHFDQAFDALIKEEGGYVNDADDHGGETKYGISQRSYPEIDIKSLTLEDAKAIYKKDFWDNLNLDMVVPEVIAIKVFNLAVNVGCKTAVIILQRAIRAAWQRIEEDGELGEATMDAVNNKCSKIILLTALRSEAAGYYRSLKNSKYEEGWLNRAYS